MNQLFYGDNLKVLREHVKDESVDLVYLDPPFNSRQDYNVLFKEHDGTKAASRIIKASSNEGDTVLDPFCGCGTAVAVAQRLNRNWIGIDITHLAINLIKKRLRDAFGEEVAKTYEVIGEPESLADAQQLARDDPYQFQWWALALVGARPHEKKRGADAGIDGRLYFHDDKSGKSKQIILSVKSGGVSVPFVRDLRGVLGPHHARTCNQADGKRSDLGRFLRVALGQQTPAPADSHHRNTVRR